jgi:hypothetical protein
MSTVTMVHTPDAPQQDRVRDTMSLQNILTPPAAVTTAPDVTTSVPVLAPPTTPTKTVAPKEEEEEEEEEEKDINSPDSVMSDVAMAEGDDDGIADGNKDGDEEDVDVPDSERDFICKNDVESRCKTGQYTMILSRKVISDHFGRNKACTRDITDWPLFCRKHYQRATYNKAKWQIRKLHLIHNQFDVIEAEFPGTTYDIHFKKSEEARLNAYARMVSSGNTSEAEAARACAPVVGKHFEAPIAILRELDLDVGKGKTIKQVKDVTEKILQQLNDGATDQVPAIEFLPNLPGKMAFPKKAPKTPSPKKGRGPRTPGSKGTPGHVSIKGSVKKSGKA